MSLPIAAVSTSVTAFVGRARRGPVNEPVPVGSLAEFDDRFGGVWLQSPLGFAVRDFFLNGGSQAVIVRVGRLSNNGLLTGIRVLARADLFNLLCVPPLSAGGADVSAEVWRAAAQCCAHRRALLLVDAPEAWITVAAARSGVAGLAAAIGTDGLKNAALYFPRVVQANPLRSDRREPFVPCGAVAGVMARVDATRGVWAPPAGSPAALSGVIQLTVPLDDSDQRELNPIGINCFRAHGAGHVIWGARTLAGDDRQASEWKYIPVRRTALHLEESLERGTRWAAFEANGERLWARLRERAGTFMQTLFRQGAFAGRTPQDGYFVRCDRETTTDADIRRGVVNILVGFAPLKPAEFIVIHLRQSAGQP